MNGPALVSDNPSPAPARPETLTVDFFEEPDALAVHARRRSGPQVFLLLWLIGWTVGCVALLGAVIKDPSLGMFAFAVPFWAAWLAVAGFLVWLMFGRETLLLRREEALFLRTALVRLTTRAVPRHEIRGFRECRSRHTENDAHLWGIEMVTLGNPVRFAFRLPDRERVWLVSQLNRFLGIEHVEAPGDEAHDAAAAGRLARRRFPRASKPATVTEALLSENTLSKPPTDCRWQMVDDVDAFAFWQRGQLSLGAVALLLFFNAFWNGIVSVFILGMFGLMPGNDVPRGWEWWGMFVFLIPFEVIGLAMFAALLIGLLEPFHCTTWRFEPDRIVCRSEWPAFRRTREWSVIALDRLELRSSGDNGSTGLREATHERAGESGHELGFVSGDNTDVCSIRDLTEGEARWMAHVIRERRADWFAD